MTYTAQPCTVFFFLQFCIVTLWGFEPGRRGRVATPHRMTMWCVHVSCKTTARMITLLSPLILDLPCCLAFSEGPGQTHVVSVRGRLGRAEQREYRPLCGSVCRWAGNVISHLFQASLSLTLSVSPSKGERSWSAGVWTCIPGLRRVSPLWVHTALPWPLHPV